MSINNRFQLIIDKLYAGNKRAFSKAVGISPTVTENIVGSRKGNPSYELLCKVCANANISERWLLSGEGNMLKSNDTDNSEHEVQTPSPDGRPHKAGMASQNLETRPRLPLEAAAGTLSILTESVYLSQCEQMPVIASLPRYDFTIPVKGDSMMPEFKSGDEVACRLVRESAFIQWGQPHIIDTYDGLVLKRIHNDGEYVRCVSDNSLYGDFRVPKKDILRLALVVGLVRSY